MADSTISIEQLKNLRPLGELNARFSLFFKSFELTVIRQI